MPTAIQTLADGTASPPAAAFGLVKAVFGKSSTLAFVLSFAERA
jgi:hypothetical protein